MVQVVLPNDANPLGFILGGTVMHLIDIAGAIACHRHTRSLLVTAAVDGLQFLHPIKVGDLIILRARVTAAWSTSLEVEVEVFSEETLTGVRRMTSRAYLTFVAIDRDGRRVRIPGLILETDDDRQKAADADQRRAERLKAREGSRGEVHLGLGLLRPWALGLRLWAEGFRKTRVFAGFRKPLETFDFRKPSQSLRPEAQSLLRLFLKILRVLRDEGLPLVGRFVERKDCFNGTRRHAGAAVDALVGVNEQHFGRGELRLVLARVNTVHRADVDARSIFRADAGFGNDVGHAQILGMEFLPVWDNYITPMKMWPRRLPGLLAWALVCLGVPAPLAEAQTLPAGPIETANGTVTVGGAVSATFGGRDNIAFFNFTDYEHNALRMFRALAVGPVATRRRSWRC